MKKVFRFAGLSMMLAAFMAVGATSGYAQADCANEEAMTLYGVIYEKYSSNSYEDLKSVVDSGKQMLEKYGTCENLAAQVDWVKKGLPGWEVRMKEASPEFKAVADFLLPRFTKFDAAVKAAKFDEMFAVGGEILQKHPVGQIEPITGFNSINQAVTLGLAGLDASYAKNTKHADAALQYAKAAVDYIKSGGKAVNKTKEGQDVFGVFQFENNRQDAVSKLTFAQGQIKFADKNDKKGGVAHFYEVTQLPGFFQKSPLVYARIGDFFYEDSQRISTELADLVKQQAAATGDEAKLAFEAPIKAKEALYNGYAERAMDAYSRAFSLAPSGTPEEKKYKDGFKNVLAFLYERRFEKKDGLDSWISQAVAKPMPNPTSEVQPITDPSETAAPTTTGSTAVNRP